MKKHFFDHLVELDNIYLSVDALGLDVSQKKEIIGLIDSSLYHTILDAILTELSEEDKKLFLSHIVEDDHDKIWNLINNKIENVEVKIKSAAESIKKELHEEIKSSKSA